MSNWEQKKFQICKYHDIFFIHHILGILVFGWYWMIVPGQRHDGQWGAYQSNGWHAGHLLTNVDRDDDDNDGVDCDGDDGVHRDDGDDDDDIG